MNPLQEQPHLFANGKFRARVGGGVIEVIGQYLYETDIWVISRHSGNWPIKDCTLIARPISDMTDKEWAFFEDKYGFGREHKNQLILNLSNREITFDLLSIGVYPFDQSHFDDGTVLIINEVD